MADQDLQSQAQRSSARRTAALLIGVALLVYLVFVGSAVLK
ncbi:MAG: hypothetical protein AAGE01_05050 [Pseudomonadota bacterium]